MRRLRPCDAPACATRQSASGYRVGTVYRENRVDLVHAAAVVRIDVAAFLVEVDLAALLAHVDLELARSPGPLPTVVAVAHTVKTLARRIAIAAARRQLCI